MKILISVSYYSPHISGLTNSIKNLAEGLAAKGYQINVLTTQHAKGLALDEIINKVHVERVPYLLKLQKGFFMPFYILPLTRQVLQSDCLLINLPQPEGVLAALFGRLFGKRVVSVYACEVSLPKSAVSFVLEQVLNFSHVVTLSLSHQVVALSDDYAKHAKLLRPFRKKTVGIYPYIQKPVINVIARAGRRWPSASKARQGWENDEAIQSTTRLPRSSVARNDGDIYSIGFIGRMSSEKGLEYLLQAIPLLKKQLGNGFVVVIAGPKAVGEQAYAKKIELLAEKYKENVSFVSRLHDDELGVFYASLDVLVLPSINSTEAFGMVQVEAMFCGTPVVASDLPGVRVPVMATGMGEIVRPKDLSDLAENIVKVLQKRGTYVQRKHIAEQIFSPQLVLSKYEVIFKE